MVSVNGGTMPRWRRDGKEMFFISPENKLIAVSVNVNGKNFEAGSPNPLFEVRVTLGGAASYAVTRDGQRFLMNAPAEQSASLPAVVVQNWTGLLKK